MRPLGIPEWANDETNIVEPSQGKKDSGHLAGEKPAAGFENWIKNKVAGYTREMANAAFAQVKSSFVTLSPDATYFPTALANGIQYDQQTAFDESTVDVWVIVNSLGTYEIVADPYGKPGGTNYQHGDLPGSADSVAINAVVYNSNFSRWVVVGDNSSQAPFTSQPKVSISLAGVGFPLVSGDWASASLPVSGLDLKGVDYSTLTGTTIAAGEDSVGSQTILRSTDGGLNWADVSPGGSVLEDGESVYCAKGVGNSARGEFVVIGQDVSNRVTGVHSTDDGLTWTDISISGQILQSSSLTTVAHNGRVWVATSSSGTEEVYTSSDGLNWGTVTLPSTIDLSPQVAADEVGGLIFLTCGTGAFYSEDDGQNWKRWTSLQYPDPLANGELGGETVPKIHLSATGQLGASAKMNDRVTAWFTPKQIMRNASYDNPDL